jgi:hypothetical protein
MQAVLEFDDGEQARGTIVTSLRHSKPTHGQPKPGGQPLVQWHPPSIATREGVYIIILSFGEMTVSAAADAAASA